MDSQIDTINYSLYDGVTSPVYSKCIKSEESNIPAQVLVSQNNNYEQEYNADRVGNQPSEWNEEQTQLHFVIDQSENIIKQNYSEQFLQQEQDICQRLEFVKKVTLCWALQESLLLMFALCWHYISWYQELLYDGSSYKPLWYSFMIITYLILFGTLFIRRMRKNQFIFFALESITYSISMTSLQTPFYEFIAQKIDILVWFFAVYGLLSNSGEIQNLMPKLIFKAFILVFLVSIQHNILYYYYYKNQLTSIKNLLIILDISQDYFLAAYLYLALGSLLLNILFICYYTCILNRILSGRVIVYQFSLNQNKMSMQSLV